MLNGSIDFGGGLLQGAGTGLNTFGALKAGGALGAGATLANPWAIGAIAAGGLAMGGLSYLAGKKDDRLANQVNRQGLELGGLQIDQMRLGNRQDREKDNKMNAFRNLFSRKFGG